jgi:hypothetical protein
MNYSLFLNNAENLLFLPLVCLKRDIYNLQHLPGSKVLLGIVHYPSFMLPEGQFFQGHYVAKNNAVLTCPS